LRHRIRLATDNREPATVADQSSDQHIQGYCALCIARCGTVAVVEDGRFTRLEPDPTGPALAGQAPELVYHLSG
jgi:hypothetical protein